MVQKCAQGGFMVAVTAMTWKINESVKVNVAFFKS